MHVRLVVTLQNGVIDQCVKHTYPYSKIVYGNEELFREEINLIKNDASPPFYYIIFISANRIPTTYTDLLPTVAVQVHRVKSIGQLSKTQLQDDFFLHNVCGTAYDSYQSIPKTFIAKGTIPSTLRHIPSYRKDIIRHDNVTGILYEDIRDVVVSRVREELQVLVDHDFFVQWLEKVYKLDSLSLYEHYFSNAIFFDENVAIGERDDFDKKHDRLTWSIMYLPGKRFMIYSPTYNLLSNGLLSSLSKAPLIMKEIFEEYRAAFSPAGENLKEQLKSMIHMIRGPQIIDPQHINIKEAAKLQLPSNGKIVVVMPCTNKATCLLLDYNIALSANLTHQELFDGLVEITSRFITGGL